PLNFLTGLICAATIASVVINKILAALWKDSGAYPERNVANAVMANPIAKAHAMSCMLHFLLPKKASSSTSSPPSNSIVESEYGHILLNNFDLAAIAGKANIKINVGIPMT